MSELLVQSLPLSKPFKHIININYSRPWSIMMFLFSLSQGYQTIWGLEPNLSSGVGTESCWGCLSSVKWMNFQIFFEGSLTPPPPLFRNIHCDLFPENLQFFFEITKKIAIEFFGSEMNPPPPFLRKFSESSSISPNTGFPQSHLNMCSALT